MIEVIKQQFTNGMTNEEKLNRSRETLQILCLKIMHDKGYTNKLSFVGGTALRILFNLRRFSEDLDFSLVNKKDYDFNELCSELIRQFKLFGFTMDTKPQNKRTVHSAMLKFEGLLKEIGLSALKGQKLSIKLEIDTNPPSGWHLENTIVNKLYMFNISHFDLSSMYATKISACFYRKYLKGRDFYDLIWYLSKRIKPNFILLNNAIEQTQGHNPGLDEKNFKNFLLEKIEKIDFSAVKKDVERFLEDRTELSLFDAQAIKDTINTIY